MNTGDIHTNKNLGETDLAKPGQAELTVQLRDIAKSHKPDKALGTNENQAADIQTTSTKTEIINIESQSDVLTALDQFNEASTKLFKKLQEGLGQYEWLQHEVVSRFRIMLQNVNASHDAEVQIERIVQELCLDITKSAISEDLDGEIPITGYNKQFVAEINRLKAIYSVRKIEVLSAVAMAQSTKDPLQQTVILEQGVRFNLQQCEADMHTTHTAMANILGTQKKLLTSEIEQFKGFEYFKDQKAWQNETVHMMIEHAEKIIKTIEKELQRLKQITDLEVTDVSILSKESDSLAAKIGEFAQKQEAND